MRVAFHNSHLNYVVIPELRNEMSGISTSPCPYLTSRKR
ncbi:hypothetical protein VCHA36P161_80165 [Vibrio chagasii]|nr:hypothetical protein VCHA50O393_150098 [Vibrio chagasii]CAH7012935.1 hypothetical protein VCHA53O474_150100 [Vibrio chagasii]CAH7078257.1 hypothetical protein VCHA37O173_80165 [Vibrio chagasii]CAH7092642.1 hypothetical protein VCHA36P161_80165 [Vibrio chagasii]CAH7117645.1 hypothetical protein VCHA29O39_90166 [Vibrio chagasii]